MLVHRTIPIISALPRGGGTTGVSHNLKMPDRKSLDFELGVDARRRESPLPGGTDHGVLARDHSALVEVDPGACAEVISGFHFPGFAL